MFICNLCFGFSVDFRGQSVPPDHWDVLKTRKGWMNGWMNGKQSDEDSSVSTNTINRHAQSHSGTWDPHLHLL